MTRRPVDPARLALVAALLLGPAAPAASAAEALYLTWAECALDPSAAHDRGSGCATNLNQQDLYCAFRVPTEVDSVLGLELVLDVQHSAVTMPDWWMFASDGCRAGELRVSFDFTTSAVCADFLLGNAAGGLQGYYVGQPRGGAGQARIKMAASVLPSFGYATLVPAEMYYGARLTITNIGTVSPGNVCPGCGEPACLVLNSILLRRQPGAQGGDVFLAAPAPANGNFATWQGGTGADCLAVPVRPVTWGRLKSLYR